jgi:hypothetical protein
MGIRIMVMGSWDHGIIMGSWESSLDHGIMDYIILLLYAIMHDLFDYCMLY